MTLLHASIPQWIALIGAGDRFGPVMGAISCTRSALAWTWMLGPSRALTALAASASGPSSSCEFCHSTDFHVVEATFVPRV
jgi:hypothetical protein